MKCNTKYAEKVLRLSAINLDNDKAFNPPTFLERYHPANFSDSFSGCLKVALAKD